MTNNLVVRAGIALLGCAAISWGQRGAEWSTNGGDAKRSGWQQNEARIVKERMSEFRLLWKLPLDNQTRALHALTAPLIVGAGFRDLAIIGGTGDNLYLLDADLGRLLWKKHFEYKSKTAQNQNATWLCPGGLLATPVIGPNGGGAESAPPPAPAAAAGPGGSAPMGAPAPAPVRRGRLIYAVSADGNLHQLSLNDGEEQSPPLPFMPPNGKPYSLNLVNDTIYANTAQNCGGNPNGTYSIDLSSPDKTVSFFPSGSGGLWGLGGPSVGSDGTVYAETGDGPADPSKNLFGTTVLALTPKELKLKDYYTPTNAEWITKRDLDLNSSPVVFSYKGRELVVGGTGKEARLFILDAKSLGGADHRTPLYRTALVGNYDVSFDARGIWGGLATWESKSGTRWILAPMWGPVHPDFRFPMTNGDAPNGSIMAFKVEDKDGQPVLTPVWSSRDLIAPAPPVVVNGIVFGLSSGEYVRQSGDATERPKRSGHATLYAFDAETGKELYSSGEDISSFTHFASLSVASGRVMLTTWDNTVYAFGIYMEH